MNIKFIFFRVLLLMLCALPATLRAADVAYIIPTHVNNVKQPVISLSGVWDFRYSPESRWTTIKVPGEVAMQGFAIEHDKPFNYRKVFTVPADYAGKRVILRFDGVYSHAKLYINGKFVREHHGGFTGQLHSSVARLTKDAPQSIYKEWQVRYPMQLCSEAFYFSVE